MKLSVFELSAGNIDGTVHSGLNQIETSTINNEAYESKQIVKLRNYVRDYFFRFFLRFLRLRFPFVPRRKNKSDL